MSTGGGKARRARARATWAVVACAASAACSGKALTQPAPPAAPGKALPRVTFTAPTNRDVDVLFVVDTSPGTKGAQAKLAAAMTSFVDALRAGRPALPNVHAAVISADLGAGALTAAKAPGCRPGGDAGVLQVAPRGACAATGLAAGARYFSVEGGVTNFGARLELADALACVAPLGDGGCLFSQPLAAVLRALGADGAPAPPENAGFLRPGAFLSIVLVTDGDDCSAPADSPVFDGGSRFVSDPDGPLTTFRCAELGLTCGGEAPPRTMATMLSGCQSAENGKLLRVSEAVSRLKALKADENSVLVAALAGPASTVAVELGAPGLALDPNPWPRLAPSCTAADGTAAVPAVRVEEWVYAFGHNGVLEGVCARDFGEALGTVGMGVAAVLGPPCIDARVASTTGPRGLRPDCTITHYGADAGATGTLVPACADVANAPPCWSLAADVSCPGGELLSFETAAGDADLARGSSVECAVCTDAADLRCR